MEELITKNIVDEAFKELLDTCEKSELIKDVSKIKKAFFFANEAHRDMKRRTGEPYIIHPIAVAKIAVQEIGLGEKSVIASLLHDVVEDTPYTLEDIASRFGEDIANVIDGLTKISSKYSTNKTSLQLENFKKIILTLSYDTRVIIIKLADRLHNMRTLAAMPKYKRIKIGGETLFLYAPLAHRLGFYSIKAELENLGLKYEHSKEYREIKNKLTAYKKENKDIILKVIDEIENKFKELGIESKISSSPKSISSIWNKIHIDNSLFEEIDDILSVNIIFTSQNNIPEKIQCWNIYSLITDIYMPKPNSIKDFISTPKSNGYEALHFTIMGLEGKWIGIRIKTEQMESIGTKGLTEYYKYKEKDNKESSLDLWLKKVKEHIKTSSRNTGEFIDEFKLNLFSSEIFIFSPKGDIITLPLEATVLDFAFEIHSQLGYQCIGAKVNLKLMPPNYQLKNGDQVEILTSETSKPKREWIQQVVTAKAKSYIKQVFKQEKREIIQKGKKMLEDYIVTKKIANISNFVRVMKLHYNVKEKQKFYYNIGIKAIDINEFNKIFKKKTSNKWLRYWKIQLSKTTKKLKRTTSSKKKSKQTVIFSNLSDENNYEIAECCNPIPGDNIIAHTLSDKKIIIHSRKCIKIIQTASKEKGKIDHVKWMSTQGLSYLTAIDIKGIDIKGIANQVINSISNEFNINIKSINFDTNNGVFSARVQLYILHIKDLNNVIMKLMSLKSIKNVKRTEQ